MGVAVKCQERHGRGRGRGKAIHELSRIFGNTGRVESCHAVMEDEVPNTLSG